MSRPHEGDRSRPRRQNVAGGRPSAMTLADLPLRPDLAPWAEGNTIPWNEPGFSARMLREHLSQDHDAASRRFEIIDRHVAWLHEAVAGGRPGRVLDLACGPGLYSSRLARRGHSCLGIDFSPASIDHARAEAARQDIDCTYRLADLRDGGFGAGFDLVLLLSGELDVFPPEDGAVLVRRAAEALAPGGALVLEVHLPEIVRAKGADGPGWSAHDAGLFSDRPHLLLRETGWFEAEQAAVERYYVVDVATGEVERHAITTRATSRDAYVAWLAGGGVRDVRWVASLEGDGVAGDGVFQVAVGSRGG